MHQQMSSGMPSLPQSSDTTTRSYFTGTIQSSGPAIYCCHGGGAGGVGEGVRSVYILVLCTHTHTHTHTDRRRGPFSHNPPPPPPPEVGFLYIMYTRPPTNRESVGRPSSMTIAFIYEPRHAWASRYPPRRLPLPLLPSPPPDTFFLPLHICFHRRSLGIFRTDLAIVCEAY